jgi:hypothetical protein
MEGHPMKHIVSAALAAAAVLATPAMSATVTFTGDTTGSPVFNRPVVGGGLSAVGTAVNYESIGFTVDLSGSYTLSLATDYDSFLVLYSGAFDPASPEDNFLVADDDSLGSFGDAQIIFDLAAGTSYFAVATAFDNGVAGPFALTIAGPGTATLIGDEGAVPEPASWAMMIAGFGLVGGALRRRTVKTSVTFA